MLDIQLDAHNGLAPTLVLLTAVDVPSAVRDAHDLLGSWDFQQRWSCATTCCGPP